MPWQATELPLPAGRRLRVTATPGPAHAERGPVVGFVLRHPDAPDDAVYLSGDTVWFDGVAEVSRRFRIRTAVLFVGAARVAAVGPWHLTFTAVEGVEAATGPSRTPASATACGGSRASFRRRWSSASRIPAREYGTPG